MPEDELERSTVTTDGTVLVLPEGVELCVKSGDDVGQVLQLVRGERYTVGSSSKCDLVVSDATVSRTHLELHVTRKGLEVADCDSHNGSFFRGARFDRVRVGVGATIRIGSTELDVRFSNAQPDSQAATRFGDMLGHSVGTRRLFDHMRRISSTDMSVLINGETGTGKELAARAIHRASARKDGPFVVCDLAGVARSLIESELFGHVRGAFTGANRNHTGAFERADGGTIFLDEVGELEVAMQPRLLRAIESRAVKPLGANDYRKVDVRVIAATNRDLPAEVKAKQFRDDLYHRLAVMKVRLPALRERREDIPGLVRHFIDAAAPTAELEVSDEVMRALADHDWPGNLRQLRNVMERAVALSVGRSDLDGSMLGLDDAEPTVAHADVTVPFKDAKDRLVEVWERDYLRTLVDACDGNVSEAARRAGLNRVTLHRLLQKHGLKP